MDGSTKQCSYRSTGNRTAHPENHRRKYPHTGAGRTDAGVHAFGQVAHFDTQSKIPEEKFADALNSTLPSGVAVFLSEEVPADFHARFSAAGKTMNTGY